jgi:hypothetical protein
MENKETPVEFLVEQIRKNTWYDEEGFGQVAVDILDIEQAKQMEKQKDQKYNELLEMLQECVNILNNPESFDLVWKLKVKELSEQLIKEVEL